MKKMLVLLFCVILMWTMASCGDTESNLKDILQNQIPTQDGPEETVLWNVKNDGLPDAKYYWGGEEVSADELQKHRGEYAADKAEFRPLTEENITAIFSGE